MSIPLLEINTALQIQKPIAEVFEAMDSFLKGGISRPVMEAQYLLQWKQQFRKRLWAGRKVQQLMGQKTTTALALKTLSVFPFMAKMIIGATHGRDF